MDVCNVMSCGLFQYDVTNVWIVWIRDLSESRDMYILRALGFLNPNLGTHLGYLDSRNPQCKILTK